MPHTSSRKKRNTISSNKRAEVVDDEGWTRVTTKAQSNSSTPSHVVSGRYYNPSNPSLKEPTESVPGPTEPLQAPPDATVEAVKVAYEKLRKMWLASDSYKDLHAAIDAHLNPARKLQHCLLFGSGSFCGMREGWIGRHDVALIQTAIFNSTVEIIESIQGSRPVCFAQEPQYNSVDKDFLSGLKITALDNPQGFEKVSEHSFAYAPGAEAAVLLRILHRVPDYLLSSNVSLYSPYEDGTAQTRFERPLEKQTPASNSAVTQAESENGARVCEHFLHGHERVGIPDLEMANHPFHQQSLYYRIEQEDP